MSATDVGMLGVIIVLLVLMTYLAVAETGLTRMSRVRALALEEEERAGASRLVRLVSHPEQFINPVLLVVLVLQTVQTALTTLLAERVFGAAGVVVALVVNVVVVFVLAEAAPKTWAVQHADRAALLTARPVHALTRFPPIRLLSRGLIGLTNVILPGKGLKQGPFVSEEEILALAAEAEEADVIEAEERVLITQIIEFGDTIVREVMVPRPDMITVPADFRIDAVMEVVLLNGYSRIPVVGESIDDVAGLVYAKDLMRAERNGQESAPVSSLMREATFVPETKRVAELLREMQTAQFHMAVVIDEYGGTAGLVTLEDLIEELVGEIVDEFDVEDARVEPLPGGQVRVNGRLSIDDANDVLGVELPEGEWDTVGGLVFSELGKVAEVGDTVRVPGAELRVDRVQGRRIVRVRITPMAEEDAAAAAAVEAEER
jgi:CBS domain containing-hemolysin-like protein